MLLNIFIPGHESFSLNFDFTDTVADVKNRIQSLSGISAHIQKLYFAGDEDIRSPIDLRRINGFCSRVRSLPEMSGFLEGATVAKLLRAVKPQDQNSFVRQHIHRKIQRPKSSKFYKYLGKRFPEC